MSGLHDEAARFDYIPRQPNTTKLKGIDIIIVKSWTGQYGQIEEALRGAIALQRRMGLVLVRSLSCL